MKTRGCDSLPGSTITPSRLKYDMHTYMHLTINLLKTNSMHKQQMTNQALPSPDLISLWDCPTICNDYIRQV